jgi:signal transduction histidine kinase
VGRARRIRDVLGIRLIDVGIAALVAVAVELNVAVGGGPGAAPLDAVAYLFGAILVVPILFRRRWPFGVLIACSVLMLIYYIVHRRDISPAPLLVFPLYDAAAAGYLAWTIVIPAMYMAIGLFVVGTSTHVGLVALAAEFSLSIVVLFLAVMLGEVVRSRKALAAETANRLRLAEEEREAESARRVAEERLRIARELHDTVAHSMATITVQAGSALHLLDGRRPASPGDGRSGDTPDAGVRAALTAIRETSKSALSEMRATLGQLRRGTGSAEAAPGGLDRLPALRDAVAAAGAPVTLAIEGDQVPLSADVDHAAYRILQESLTNVLRHAGPDAAATVSLRYEPDALTIRVTDNGAGPPSPGNGPPGHAGANGHAPAAGHGLTGMGERAASVGGEVTAGPRADGGFEVVARLPIAAADLPLPGIPP